MTNEPKASPETSIVTMWVLLEGDPSAVEIDVDSSKYTSGNFNLDRLKPILKNKFPDELQGVRSTKIEFFNSSDRTTPLRSGMILTNDNTTDENPLVVRYPLSNSSIVVTYKSGNSKETYEMPHSSGSWNLLRDDVEKNFKRLLKFEEIEACDLYFEYSNGDQNNKIETEFQFNTLMKRVRESNGTRTLPEFKVLIKGKKPYSEWEFNDAFKEVLHKEVSSIGDIKKFDLNDLPNHTPLTKDELKFFVDSIQITLDAFKKVININEATSREYISIFMKTAVKHIQVHTNLSTQLFVEDPLNGTRGYGPLDYLVKLNEIAMLVNEAKMKNIIKGIAQAIMQLHSMKEKLGKRKLDETEFESPKSLFGIVSTGSIWYFIRWTGSRDHPIIEISDEYHCDFTGDMQSAKNVVSYIVRILQSQDGELKNKSKRVRKDDNEGSRDCAGKE